MKRYRKKATWKLSLLWRSLLSHKNLNRLLYIVFCGFQRFQTEISYCDQDSSFQLFVFTTSAVFKTVGLQFR